VSDRVELFGADYSVYVRICRIALAEKGIDYTLRPIDVFADGGPPRDYLDLNPFGRVPALRHGAFELYETGAITAYVDEAFEGPDLMPDDVKARARARQIMQLADNELYPHLVWGVYVPWQDANPMPGLQRADLILGELERLAADHWMAGEQFSLADAYVYPMLNYFSSVPEGAGKLSEFAGLASWMMQTGGRESIVLSQVSAEKN